jgi:glycine oxidase
MTAASAKSIVIAGGGAIGLTCALVLARAGYGVVLADPAARGANASGVAAGMLAPAFESVLDPASKGLFALLRAGRDAWLDLLPQEAGRPTGLSQPGALWVPTSSGIGTDAMAESFIAIGAQFEILTAAAAQALSPGLDPKGAACLLTPEDWCLDVTVVTERLYQEATRLGVQFTTASVTDFSPGTATLSDGRLIQADHLVIAAGLGRGMASLAPELACLSPIKGQILFFEGAGPRQGPAIRSAGGYVVARAAGAMVGATMEFGLDDLTPDAVIKERLRGVGASLYPQLATATAQHWAGVRAATPDGLPLVGPSRALGVILACGARRNGWLLAALVAKTVAAQLSTEALDPFATQMDPRRFDMA